MNYGTVLAMMASFLAVGVTVLMSLQDPLVLLDLHSIIIVFGGTLAVAFTCFPYQQVLNLFKVFIKGVMGRQQSSFLDVVDQVALLSLARRQGRAAFERAVEEIKHPFLREGGKVLYWTEADISREELRDLLETRAETMYSAYTQDAHIFKTISKFPPAFGLIGTVIGMIALLQAIGVEGGDNIGPAMSVALMATFYGIVLSNVVFAPLGEFLGKKSRDELLVRRMIIEGLMLIHEGRPSKHVAEKVKSFLLPSQRVRKAG